MLAGKARELDAEAERVASRLAELTAAEAHHAGEIQREEGQQDALNQRIYTLDAELRQNQNHLNLTALEVDRSENRIAFNRQRTEELAGRHGQIAAEMAEAAARAAEWDSRNAAQQQAVIALRDESGVLSERVEELAARAETRRAQIRDWELRIEALRASASEAGESLLRLHGEQKQADSLFHAVAAVEVPAFHVKSSCLAARTSSSLRTGRV